jgi:hypothetical protein
MRLQKFTLIAVLFSVLGLNACQQEETIVKKEDVSQETLDKIYRMGFGTSDVKKIAEGYLVEGDILLTDEQLNASHEAKLLRVGETEQYRTTNLVKVSSSREIEVSISSTLPSAYVKALDEALERYNALGLRLTFVRVSDKADITIAKSPDNANYLASAGFPNNSGNPYNKVVVNSAYLGSNPRQSYLATILAHEIGHCIGFRHTDYMDRSYSCGGTATNEGASSVGAVHIPGTPETADRASWMLACIGDGQSRPFNTNDEVALEHLY